MEARRTGCCACWDRRNAVEDLVDVCCGCILVDVFWLVGHVPRHVDIFDLEMGVREGVRQGNQSHKPSPAFPAAPPPHEIRHTHTTPLLNTTRSNHPHTIQANRHGRQRKPGSKSCRGVPSFLLASCLSFTRGIEADHFPARADTAHLPPRLSNLPRYNHARPSSRCLHRAASTSSSPLAKHRHHHHHQHQPPLDFFPRPLQT